MLNAETARAIGLALNLILAGLLVRACVTDLASRIISNRLNLTIALLAPIYWVAVGLSPWPDMAIQLGLAATVFALFALAFHFGMMGGGDVKLAAALALWFSVPDTIRMIVIMSLAGGVLTLFVIWHHKHKGRLGRPEIPYGVAIAVGAWAILAQRFLNHFA